MKYLFMCMLELLTFCQRCRWFTGTDVPLRVYTECSVGWRASRLKTSLMWKSKGAQLAFHLQYVSWFWAIQYFSFHHSCLFNPPQLTVVAVITLLKKVVGSSQLSYCSWNIVNAKGCYFYHESMGNKPKGLGLLLLSGL